jgi:hypothetical protein
VPGGPPGRDQTPRLPLRLLHPERC